jgi:hypothetical protein
MRRDQIDKIAGMLKSDPPPEFTSLQRSCYYKPATHVAFVSTCRFL